MSNTPSAAVAVLALAVSLGACQTGGSAPETALSKSHPPAFVEAACGGCHAVEPPFLSPNPQAPSFEAIANRKGLTEDTLASWLSDAHNYPEDMDFDLEPGHVEQIAAYMVTLRREDYKPQPN